MQNRAFYRVRNAAGLLIGAALIVWLRADAGPAIVWGNEPAKPATDLTTKDGLTPLTPNESVLLDKKGKRLLLKTQVALREGQLELLCCLKQTKEHESILSIDARAQVIHAALLALGAKTGTPVNHTPEFQPPTGQKLEIFLNWTDTEGKAHRVPAQQWVRHATRRFWSVPVAKLPDDVALPKNTELRYDRKLKELSWYGPMSTRERDRFLALSSDEEFRKAIRTFFTQSQSREMQADFVFAGSGFYRDEETNKEFYLAEDGDLICVANFPSATIDVAVESTSQGDGLLFEAWTERIPPKETPVTIEIVPVFERAKEGQGEPGKKKTDAAVEK